MRLLFVISNLGIGGEQRVASILTDYFVQNGHEVDILVYSEKSDKMFAFNPKIRITYCDTQHGLARKFRKFLVTRKMIQLNSYDVVIGFAIIPSVVCCFASLKKKVPVIISERNDPLIYSRVWKGIRRVGYTFAAGGVFQTKAARNCIPYIKDENVRIIPNPLELDKLPPVYDSERKKVIVNTARMTSVKNQIVLIKAFEKIANKYRDYQLYIYGDGAERKNLISYVSNHKLDSQVVIKDATPSVLNEIREYSIFVLPSKNEGFPNSLAEALALGLPSISTDCRIGGPHDMLYQKERGILVPVDDVDSLASALEFLIKNSEVWKIYSKNAVKIRDELNSKHICGLWMQLINDVCYK